MKTVCLLPVLILVSHGHQDQNAFALAAYGEPLAIPSGYYNFWGSLHHFGWTQQTKAKCAITFDGGKGQPRGAQYKGKVAHFEQRGDVFRQLVARRSTAGD